MSYQIVPQPNGRYAIFSTGCDQFHALNLTEEQVVADFVERAVESTRRECAETFARIKAGPPPHYWSWAEAVETHRANVEPHGDEDFEERLDWLIEEFKAIRERE